MFYEQSIQPHHAGFGQFQLSYELGQGWAEDTDLLQEIIFSRDEQIFELGADGLPRGLDDIRGHIQGGPRAKSERIFGYLDDQGAHYFAIVEIA